MAVEFPITVIASDTEPVVRYIRALNAEILRLQVENETMRSICDAAFSATRQDADNEEGWTSWQNLLDALADARWEEQ